MKRWMGWFLGAWLLALALGSHMIQPYTQGWLAHHLPGLSRSFDTAQPANDGQAHQGHVHPYADERTWMGIAHAGDVLSNLAFLFAGLVGMLTLRRVKGAPMQSVRRPDPARQGQLLAAHVFFLGLILTSLGSAWYHLAPDPARLVLDRLGMAIGFAGILALAAQDQWGANAGDRALAWLLPVALVSAILPHVQGNVLPWALLQYGGVLYLVFVAWRQALGHTVAGRQRIHFGAVVAIYVVAKLLENADAAVFEWTGHLMSGHSLKHLVAAAAALPVLAAFQRQEHDIQ